SVEVLEFQPGKGVRCAPWRVPWRTLRRTRAASGTRLPPASSDVASRPGRSVRRRKRDGEGGALPDGALEGDVAAHQAREAAGQREPQADPLAPSVRRTELAEHAEHGLVVLRRDPGPRVATPDGDTGLL